MTSKVVKLAPYQERVLTEQSTLEARIVLLVNFITQADFLALPPLERSRLTFQLACMQAYNDVLNQRIEDF